MSELSKGLQHLQQRIRQTALTTHSNPDAVQIIAVSKLQSLEKLQAAYDLGIRHFGENYLQEAIGKITRLKNYPITWHFIGKIQSNKTRQIAEHFSWCHTLDQLKIAQRLNDQRPLYLTPLQVCIQVNIDNEPQKAGATVEETETLALSIQAFSNLQLRGLMCIPQAEASPTETQTSFYRLRKLLNQLQKHPQLQTLDTLSMGMSADLELAVAEGATFVRIGTALFGERHP